MNIFVTDLDPEIAAQNLDSKRVVKMILESAQLLSTAMNVSGITKGPYRTTHINHPCSVWARQTNENFRWLVSHFYYLCQEYEYRFNKVHKCFQYYDLFKEVDTEFKFGPLTNFPNCTTFKEIPEITKAYRTYMNYKWQNDKIAPKWHNRKRPDWVLYNNLTNNIKSVIVS